MKKECPACKRPGSNAPAVVDMELLRTRKIHYGIVRYWIDAKGHRLVEWERS